MAEVRKERRPPNSEESVKLFVGQVPKHMNEAQLLTMFQEFSLVDEVNIIKDKTTRASRGCCFVICPSREEADKAVNACHNKKTLPGASSPLQVKYADGELERLEHKLFVGMLPKNVSEVEVSDLFSKYGTVKDLQILRGSQQTSKGCAFLKYETKEQALAALEAVNGKHKMEGSSVPLVVKWADTEKERLARRAQKDHSQGANVPNSDSQPPSLFGALPMGYVPSYNDYSYPQADSPPEKDDHSQRRRSSTLKLNKDSVKVKKQTARSAVYPVEMSKFRSFQSLTGPSRSPPCTLISTGKSRPLPDQKHLAARSATSAGTITMDDDMDNEQGRVISADKEPEGLPDELKGLSMYFSLFPSDYEFRRDELVQMWMAEGFIDESQRKTMEDIGCACFNSLEKIGFLVPSRCDFSVDFDSVCSVPSYNPGKLLFKVNPIKLSELINTTAPVDYFVAVAGSLDGDLELTQHLSLNCKDIDQMTFGILKNFKHLRTLLLLCGHESSIKHIPRDPFLSLKDLRTLNLSRTLISEVPSSIRNMKSLRYLDLSNTRITQLPESIDFLCHLQTIKLRGCVHFLQLPNGMKKLINLRHMDLDIIRQLRAMPPFLGNLTNLLTLSAFLVGREEGCQIGELQNLNNLRGVLRISRLENVSDKDEAKEAALINKQYLQRLELRWSNVFIEKIEEQKKILDCLQPHAGLKELQIQHYAGSTLPTWISHPSLAALVVLTLYRCINCQLLPSIGQLQMLKSLSIIEMNEVKEINHQFYGDGLVDQAFHAFPKLEILEVDIMFKLKEWKEVKTGDFPSLLKLTMDSCPELDSLPSLSWLKSFKHLEFRRCPKLLSLPSNGLPTSLESFIVIDCPELKEWCRKVEGEDWSKIYHVPSIWFDCEEVRSKSHHRPGTSGEISEVNMELDG